MVFRAAGHGMKVFVLQFLKNDDTVGELKALNRFENITVIQHGCGFVPKPDHSSYQKHVDAAKGALELAEKAVKSGEYDLVMLDEICGATYAGLVDESRVLELMAKAKAGSTLVLTGRNASEKMIAIADTVSEMVQHKHAMEQGTPAQKGVEF